MDSERPEALERSDAWLQSYQRGEREALARVYRVYAPQVARYVRAGARVRVDGQPQRLGGGLPEAEVEAVVQEVFTRALAPETRRRYDGARPFEAYLLTIARNLLVDRARRLKVRGVTLSVDDLEAHLASERQDADPEAAQESRELDALLQRFRAGLEASDQHLFDLRYAQGQSMRQTAEALGLTEVIVRRLDTRLRANLLEALRAGGFLEQHTVSIGSSLLGRIPTRKTPGAGALPRPQKTRTELK